MKKLIQILLVISSFFSNDILIGQGNSSSNTNKVEKEDIKKFIGKWSGTLTYLDYTSRKPYTMPCELTIEGKRKNKKLILNYSYPNEPKANNKGKIKFSNNGISINKKDITSKAMNTEGQLEILLEYPDKDGNNRKKALVRNIYKIGSKNLTIRKEVKFEDSTEWIMRNEYSFKKK